MKGLVLTVLCMVALSSAAVVNKYGKAATSNDDPSQAPTICAAEDSDGVLVAHEICNNFYKCSFGVPVAMKCPSNLLYDPSGEICDWAYAVECGDRVIVEREDEGGDWTGDGAGNSDPSQAPAICAAEGSDHVLIAHENCNQFYQCWAGQPVVMNCPLDHLFNPDKDYCDFPFSVDCGDRVIADLQDNGNGNQNGNDNDKVDDDIPTGNNHDDPSQVFEICRAEGSESVLVAHENCNQFYTCNFGIPVTQICAANLLFDPSKDRCEWRDTVDCGDRIIPEYIEVNPDGNEWTGNGANNDDPSQAPAICAAEDSDHTYIAHENCNQFYKCWDGLPVAMDCPENLFFNPKKDYCDFAINVDCSSRIVV